MHQIAACVVFLAVSLAVTAIGRDDRSAWILMTAPWGADHQTNPLIGYSWLHGGTPFMKEGIPGVTQVGVFTGVRQALPLAELRQDFRFIRGIYAFATSLLSPIVGILPAMLAVNWLAWAACAAVAWSMTREISGSDLAALVATILVAGGTGMTSHIGDYGPHLLSFATYYAGVWFIYRSRIWQERRPFTTHLHLGAYMAVACLTYNTGVMLAGVYLVNALRLNRWLHAAAATLLALSARPIWQIALGPGVEDLEGAYLAFALGNWRELLFATAPWTTVKTVGRWITEYLFFVDSPLVVTGGLAACLLARMPLPLRFLGASVVAMPILAALVFAPSANARGYLVYGGTVWLYCCLATCIAAYARGGRSLRTIVVGATAVVIATHLAWSTAYLWHKLGPLKSFFLGWDDGIPYFDGPPDVVSITGFEPTPVLFAGTASLTEAGAHLTSDVHRLPPGGVDFLASLRSRALLTAYLVLFAVLALDTRRRKLAAATGLIAAVVASAGIAKAAVTTLPAFFPVDRAAVLPPGGVLTYDVDLGPGLIDRFRRGADPDDAFGVMFRPDPLAFERNLYGVARVRLFADGRELPPVRIVDRNSVGFHAFAPGDRDQALEALARARTLTCRIESLYDRDLEVAGWQRPDLLGRAYSVVGPDGAPGPVPTALPVIELRRIGADGRLEVAAF